MKGGDSVVHIKRVETGPSNDWIVWNIVDSVCKCFLETDLPNKHKIKMILPDKLVRRDEFGMTIKWFGYNKLKNEEQVNKRAKKFRFRRLNTESCWNRVEKWNEKCRDCIICLMFSLWKKQRSRLKKNEIEERQRGAAEKTEKENCALRMKKDKCVCWKKKDDGTRGKEMRSGACSKMMLVDGRTRTDRVCCWIENMSKIKRKSWEKQPAESVKGKDFSFASFQRCRVS